MKNPILLIVLTMVFLACKPMQSEKLTSIQYKAQTRGYSLSIAVNPSQVLRIENGKETIRTLTPAQWNLIETSIKDLDFSTISNTVDKELTAVDRGIPALLSIVKGAETTQIEFIHNAAPTAVQKLLKLIQ
ncbi:MAG: hypothetical protein JKY08_08105 [Flavobacteriaceae bacterium]|nr:hypothetical protein [Flavobacteriaceae bacterium]